jgi:hypothetical protein
MIITLVKYLPSTPPTSDEPGDVLRIFLVGGVTGTEESDSLQASSLEPAINVGGWYPAQDFVKLAAQLNTE